MNLSAVWAKKAEKELDGLDAGVRARVIAAIDRFAENGHGDVKALKGHVGEFRLRIGDWRVRIASTTATTRRASAQTSRTYGASRRKCAR